MMKKILALAVLACASAFAALQFEVQDVGSMSGQETRYGQPWIPAHQFVVHMNGAGSLWIRNEITNWYGENPDLNTELNMTAGNYGTIGADGSLNPVEFVTKDFSYEDPRGDLVSTTGYFMGNYEAGDDVYFWITTLNGEVGRSNGYVNDYAIEEAKDIELGSRQLDFGAGIDLPTGQRRMKFGFVDAGGNSIGGVEFVFDAITTGDNGDKGGTAGAPLPGAWATLALVGGLMGAKKMKKSKK